MNLVAQALHVRKFFIALNPIELAAAFALPRVVNVDVSPAVIDQARRNYPSRALEHFLGIYPAAPAIPTVPSHRRRQRYLFPHHDPEFFLVRALAVFCTQRYDHRTALWD